MIFKCSVAKTLVAVLDWNQRVDKAWKAGLDAEGFRWQKAVAYTILGPIFVLIFPVVLVVMGLALVVDGSETIADWARRAVGECRKKP